MIKQRIANSDALKAGISEFYTFFSLLLTHIKKKLKKNNSEKPNVSELNVFLKFHRYAVHTITQSGRFRTIIKNVSEMRVAAVT